jgi:hypothetical protein
MSEQTEIYVARHEHGYIKIGKSDNPLSRIKKLQTGCPYEITLCTTITVEGDWHVVEAALHDAYVDRRLRGEWFDIPDHEIRNLAEITRLDPEIVNSLDEFSPSAYIERRDRQRGEWVLRGRYSRTRESTDTSDDPLLQLIDTLREESDGPCAPISEVIDQAVDQFDLDHSEVKERIEDHRVRGNVYEPRRDWINTV